MKRLLFVAVGSAVALMLAGGTALADNGPHVKTATPNPVADGCAGCHRAHTAKAPKQLVQAQPALCYTCHGATGAGASTDVADGQGYSASDRTVPAGALRGGGFSYALIDSGNPSGASSAGIVPARATGAAVTSTHSVDGTSQMAWGNGAISGTASYGKAVSLVCGSCHDPHGNGNYRILKPIPNESGATTPGTVITDTPTVPGAPKVYTTANYWKTDDANNPTFIANIAAWCATCHTRYLSSGDGKTGPSGDAVYTYRHTSNGTTAGSKNCIQCHVAHGSNASMGTFSGAVANPDGTAAAGDSRLLRIDNRGTCQMCHQK